MNFFATGGKLVAGLSDIRDGSMRIHDGDNMSTKYKTEKRINSFFLKICHRSGASISDMIDAEPIIRVSAGLEHGKRVGLVGRPKEDFFFKNVDALVTKEKNVVLTVTNADCPTLFLYDAVTNMIGIAHCGWKGILKGIVENTVGAMKKGGSSPKFIQAFISPGIQPCHFEVQKNVADSFLDSVSVRDKRTWVDLGGEINRRLIAEKVGMIVRSYTCTYCAEIEKKKPLYFSYRRDKTDPLETQIGMIMLRK